MCILFPRGCAGRERCIRPGAGWKQRECIDLTATVSHKIRSSRTDFSATTHFFTINIHWLDWMRAISKGKVLRYVNFLRNRRAISFFTDMKNQLKDDKLATCSWKTKLSFWPLMSG